MMAVTSKHFLHPDCGQRIDGGGWRLVRHVPPGNRWHKATDNLAGTAVYGDANGGATSPHEWSIRFDSIHFDQFLLSTGNCQKWLVTTKEAAIGTIYSNAQRTILKSSTSETPYQARWYNRGALDPPDPWLSLSDHNDAIEAGEILYGEHHWRGAWAENVLPAGNGANVYIRDSSAQGKSIS